MAKKIYDAVATIREEGRDKPRYVNVGAVIEGDKGLSLKLETIPVGPGWNGWISFYTPKQKEEPQRSSQGAMPDGEDLPFAPMR